MRKVLNISLIIFLAAVCSFVFVSCKDKPDSTSYASVTFAFSSAAFTSGNVENYRIQYRAIPLFGNSETKGRAVNWTDIAETSPNSGYAKIDTVQTGNWIFYVRVSDSKKTFIDICTGTKTVNNDLIIRIDEEDNDLTGYGEQSIYIRADFVYEKQTLLVEYQDTATDLVITIDQSDTEIIRNTRTTVDYYLTTGKIPAGNYLVTAKIIGENGTVIFSKQASAAVRSTGTDALIMKISTESAVDGSVVIIGGEKLSGYITGPSEITLGEEAEYKFYASNTYTTDNAVWYYWYAEDTRYSTKEKTIRIKFKNPGMYSISCIPVGINGEIIAADRQQDVELKTKVNPVTGEL